MSREEKASISIVITNYNKGEKLNRCYSSIAHQLAQHDELIIVDDCSTDDKSRRCLERLSLEKLKIIKNEKNMGVSFSKNRGVFSAKNDCIVLVDADDWLPNNSLKLIREAFTENPDAWLIFGDYIKITSRRNVVDCACLYDEERANLDEKVLAKNWLLLGVSPFRKSKCFSVCSFDTRFNRTDDVDFHRRIITTSGFKAAYINSPIYYWDCQDEGNNHSIPSDQILYSHLAGFWFFTKNLTGLAYLKFILKLAIRLIYFHIPEGLKLKFLLGK